MNLWQRLRTLLSGESAAAPLAPRRERREAARRRERGSADPAWTADDRHLGAAGDRTVAEVAPGTPGHFGSVHSVRDD